jgi:hypothetical protein
MTNYWLICYQLYGYHDFENVVVKDEHPIDYIARKNEIDSREYLLVNFWEITESQYLRLSKIPLFKDDE